MTVSNQLHSLRTLNPLGLLVHLLSQVRGKTVMPLVIRAIPTAFRTVMAIRATATKETPTRELEVASEATHRLMAAVTPALALIALPEKATRIPQVELGRQDN